MKGYVMVGKIRVVGKRGKGDFRSQLDFGDDFVHVACTSRNPDPVMCEGLSPLYLGPVVCFDDAPKAEK